MILTTLKRETNLLCVPTAMCSLSLTKAAPRQKCEIREILFVFNHIEYLDKNCIHINFDNIYSKELLKCHFSVTEAMPRKKCCSKNGHYSWTIHNILMIGRSQIDIDKI